MMIKNILYQLGLIIPDKLFLCLKFYKNFGRFPNLKDPVTFNEKLNWLKLHVRDAKYTSLVDKYLVKDIVGNIIGHDHIIPTLGVWNSPDDIDFDSLPDKFVLKTTHGSGDVIVCKDKSKLNIEKVKRDLRRALRDDLYAKTREWPYKNVQRRIIAEQYMVDESGTELKDYKFFCFDGKPKMLFVATDRPFDTRFDFYDTEFKHLPFKQGHPLASKEIKKPKGFEEMLKVSEKLSQGFPHARIDLYDINGHIYFGELTFFHFSAAVPFEPEEWDYKIGEWLKLPRFK